MSGKSIIVKHDDNIGFIVQFSNNSINGKNKWLVKKNGIAYKMFFDRLCDKCV